MSIPVAVVMVNGLPLMVNADGAVPLTRMPSTLRPTMSLLVLNWVAAERLNVATVPGWGMEFSKGGPSQLVGSLQFVVAVACQLSCGGGGAERGERECPRCSRMATMHGVTPLKNWPVKVKGRD